MTNSNETFLHSLPEMTRELALDAIDQMVSRLADSFGEKEQTTEEDIEIMNDALLEALEAADIPIEDYLDYLLAKED